LGKMVETLQQIAGVAERIAQGDLNVQVAPRSGQDVLLISMGTLLAAEQEVAAVVEKLSLGDLRVEVKNARNRTC